MTNNEKALLRNAQVCADGNARQATQGTSAKLATGKRLARNWQRELGIPSMATGNGGAGSGTGNGTGNMARTELAYATGDVSCDWRCDWRDV